MLHYLRTRSPCARFFLICLVLNLGFSGVGLRNSLLEVHDFRQVQTALTARSIHEYGWRLDYPTPLFGPPWSAPMEFPFYQLCAVTVGSLTGLPLEVAGRFVALAFLYFALPACFQLAGSLGLRGERQWLFPAVILITPVYLYYSRTFMIESTALAATAWFLLGYVRALEGRGRRWLWLAALAGMAAALIKVTTLIICLVAAAAYTLWILQGLWRKREEGSVRLIVQALIATVPAVLLGTAWVRYSDSVKASNPLAVFLTSANLRDFNFGTLHQRLTLAFWERIYEHTTLAVAPAFNLSVIAIFAMLLGGKLRARTAWLLLGFAAGPLVFANLYFVHDYYFYANGVFLLGALALVWNELLDLTFFSPAAQWSVIALSVALQLGAYLPTYFQVQWRQTNQPAELASILSRITKPADILLVFGDDWSSHLSYYAHRRSVMVRDIEVENPIALHRVIDHLAPDRITALVVSGNLRKYPDAVGPFIKQLGLRPDPLLVNNQTLVYVAEDRYAAAIERLATRPPATFDFAAPRDDTGSDVPRARVRVSTLSDPALFAMMSPKPVEIIHPFGLGVHEIDGRKVFNAHAPTDVIFLLPGGATTIKADFGILLEASIGKNRTEGVEFRVELINPEGVHQTLRSIYLSPSLRPADRGSKTMQISLPPHASGRLVFRTLPGPTGSIACAWAYWASIEIR